MILVDISGNYNSPFKQFSRESPPVLAGNVTELAAEMADMRAEVMGLLTDLNAKLDKIALSIMYK